jgi:hypothetical protein
MPKGKGYPDMFGLKSFESQTNAKKLSQQPGGDKVPGATVNTIGKRPSQSRTVSGMPEKLRGK